MVLLLVGLTSPEQLKQREFAGPLFEGLILSEYQKKYLALGWSVPFYFWKQHQGLEVDLLIEIGGKLHAFKVKSSATYDPKYLATLKKWQEMTSNPPSNSFLIYGGNTALVQNGIHVCPWNQLPDVGIKTPL